MKIISCCIVALAAITGCQSVQLDSTPPAGFNLTGTWKLNAQLSDPPPLKNNKHKDNKQNKQARPVPASGRRGNQRNNRPRPGPTNTPLAFITRDFPVLASRQMHIEQNLDSLGVDYGRGGYRDVSWGQRDRGYWQVTAGWEDNVFVIFSKSNDQVVYERHSLSLGGKVLTINIDYQDSTKDLELTRVYHRQP